MFDDRTYQVEGSGMDSTLLSSDGEPLLSINYNMGEIIKAAKDGVANPDKKMRLDIMNERSGDVAYEIEFKESDQNLFQKSDVRVSIRDAETGEPVVAAETSEGGGYDDVGIVSGESEKYGIVTSHRFLGRLTGQSRLPMGLSMYEVGYENDDQHRISWTEGSLIEKISSKREKIKISQNIDDKRVAVLGLLAASMSFQSRSTLNPSIN